MDCKVAVSSLSAYDVDQIESLFRSHLEAHAADSADSPAAWFAGKKVVLKPNLLNKRGPVHAVTTHPGVVVAAIRVIKSYGPASITIAESPAGLYSEKSLREAYVASGFKEAAEAEGAVFNYDTSELPLAAPNGVLVHEFSLIRPIVEADVIVDLCKLKTHSLTKMTCAVKNLFGTIPGTDKVEMHARFSEPELFYQMLIDLCRAITEHTPVLAICDAIQAMEGDGPGTGEPRYLNTLLSSWNPFALDLACEHLIGFDGTVPMVRLAAEQGLAPNDFAELEVEDIFLPTTQKSTSAATAQPILESNRVTDFVAPGSSKITEQVKLLPGFVRPRPVIVRDTCRGCGVCVRSCPQHTITLKKGKAKINPAHCIRCFCCQELCPFKSITVKRSFVFGTLLKKL